jgi:hypothetical protein
VALSISSSKREERERERERSFIENQEVTEVRKEQRPVGLQHTTMEKQGLINVLAFDARAM